MPEVLHLDLYSRRRSLVGYLAGIAAYALVVVAMYPAFKNSTSLDNFIRSDATAAALFGVTGKISSSGGWLNGNLFANFFPLVMLLLTVGYGAACIAGQDEEGTLGLVATLPVSRRRLTVEKFATVCLLALPVAGVTMLCVLIGAGFGLHISTANLAGATAGVWLLAIDFGALAMLIGAATGSRGTALGATSALAAAAYIISSLAPVVHWIHPLRFASPFFYAIGDEQLVHGLNAGWAAVLAGIAAVLGIATTKAFQRLDVD